MHFEVCEPAVLRVPVLCIYHYLQNVLHLAKLKDSNSGPHTCMTAVLPMSHLHSPSGLISECKHVDQWERDLVVSLPSPLLRSGEIFFACAFHTDLTREV